MLQIHFNHTGQLLVTEQEEKRSKLCWVSSFKKKKKFNRKIISICLSCSFPIPLSSSLSCQGQNDVIHRLFNWNCTQPNHRAAAPLEVSGKMPTGFNGSKLGLSMDREQYNISLGDPEKGPLRLWDHALVHVLWYLTSSCIAAYLVVSSASFESLHFYPTDFIANFWCLASICHLSVLGCSSTSCTLSNQDYFPLVYSV